MRLGKKLYVRDERDLKFSRYVSGVLPTIPNAITNSQYVERGFEMFGNDIAGDCVPVGAYNMTKVWRGMNKQPFIATTENVLSIYTKATGYNKNDPSTDRGTSMRDFLKLWRTDGIVDSFGNVYKIDAFVRLDSSNLDHLFASLYLFGGVFAGFMFPASAMRQFQANAVWSVESREPTPNEGHCVPIIDKAGLLSGATWSKNQYMTMEWYQKYNDEAYAVLSEEMLSDEGCQFAGFNLDDLKRDLLIVQK